MCVNDNGSCVFGVTVDSGILEIYGVDPANAVTIHGWFDYSVGLAILAGRTPSIISAQADDLPEEVLDALRAAGHGVITAPSHPRQRNSHSKIRAKSLCEGAVKWINSDVDFEHPVAARSSSDTSLHRNQYLM